MISIALSDLDRHAHRGEEPAVMVIAAHPTLVKVENVLHQTLHRLYRLTALGINAPMTFGTQFLTHLLAFRSFVLAAAPPRQQLNIILVFQVAIERIIIGLAVHAGNFDPPFKLRQFGLQPLSFVGTIRHPFERPQHLRVMRSEAKSAMPVHPAIRPRKTPSRFPIQPVQTVGHNPLLFLLFVPDRPARFDHHFVGTDHSDGRQLIGLPGILQEKFEK